MFVNPNMTNKPAANSQNVKLSNINAQDFQAFSKQLSSGLNSHRSEDERLDPSFNVNNSQYIFRVLQ